VKIKTKKFLKANKTLNNRKNVLDYSKKKQKECKLNRKLSYFDANSLDIFECDYSRDVWLG